MTSAVAIDGGEIVLSLQIDGGEIILLSIDGGEIGLNNSVDGGEQGVFFPVYPDPYTGTLDVTPKAFEDTSLECAHKTMPGDVVVRMVPYYETHNPDGFTVYIASEV